MKDSEGRTTIFVGKVRVYMYERTDRAKGFGLKLPGAKTVWYASPGAVERALSKFAKGKPKTSRMYHTGEHSAEVMCQCGCGVKFNARYKTRVPRFFDDSHRSAYNTKIRDEKRAAKMKKLLGEQRKRRLDQKALIGPERDSFVRKGGGKGEREGETPAAGLPPSQSTEARGLFAAEKEPQRTNKRRKVGLE